VLRCALVSLIACFALCAQARAGILDGIAAVGDGGTSNSSNPKYPSILMSERGFNFGGATLPYNVGSIGATSSSVLATGNQIDQVVAQVQAGNVSLVLLMIGDNDWFPNAAAIATGAMSGAALTNFQTGVVNNITTAVDRVLDAGGKVVLGGFSNIVDAPAASAIYANPTWKATLEGALMDADDMLIDYTSTQNVPFIDFVALERMVYDSGHFEVGGVDISLTTVGSDPHNFFRDSENAGTVVRGVITNLFIQAINEGYGTNIALLSDLEILTIAGIGNEYTGETFVPTIDFGSFVTVPEPSSWALGLLGVVLVAVGRRARRSRPA
jgi:hypothetical protein